MSCLSKPDLSRMQHPRHSDVMCVLTGYRTREATLIKDFEDHCFLRFPSALAMQSAQGSASTSSTPSGSLPAFLRAAASNSAGDAATSAAPSQLRLQALYASTAAQRSANPTGYSANAAWWADALESGLRSGYINANGASSSSSGKAAGDAAAAVMADRLVLKVDDGLLARLEWEGRRPRGIGGFVVRLFKVPAKSGRALNARG